jgi:hypothetical protein
MIGKVFEYPFDTVKVRLQSQPDDRPLRYRGPIDCFAQSLRQDGLRGMYRGISSPLVGAAAENSCLFFSVSDSACHRSPARALTKTGSTTLPNRLRDTTSTATWTQRQTSP